MGREQKPFDVILLGDPASGKATQAARLVAKYGFYDFDMGREVRKPAVRAKFNYAKTTGSGKLTPTAIVREILERTIRTAPRNRGILFDGHPKMIGEARLVVKWLREHRERDPIVIYLSVPASITVRRAAKRVERVGGIVIKREDDSERALRNRWKYYREQVSRVVALFQKKYRFKKISGVGSETVVARRIAATIEALRKP